MWDWKLESRVSQRDFLIKPVQAQALPGEQIKMKKVLVIDDEIDLCLMIRQFLEKKHYAVHIAHNLSDGMNSLREVQPDALILDNNLPDGMGWEAVAAIHEQFPDMRITLLSAYNLADHFSASLNASIRILEKPVSMHDIEQLL